MGGIARAISGFFTPQMQEQRAAVAPPAPPAQTADGTAAADQAAKDEAARRATAGRASTVLTSATGLEDDPTKAKKYLLGS